MWHRNFYAYNTWCPNICPQYLESQYLTVKSHEKKVKLDKSSQNFFIKNQCILTCVPLVVLGIYSR